VVVEPSEVCQKPVARSRFWPPPRYRRNPQVRNDGDAWPSGVAATAIASMSSCVLRTPQDSEEARTTRERDEVDGIVRPRSPPRPNRRSTTSASRSTRALADSPTKLTY